MKKRKTRKKVNTLIHTSNIIAVTLCIVAMGLLIATCLNSFFVHKQQTQNIQKINELIFKVSNDAEYTTDKVLEEVYLSYYYSIDQKATDSINIALSFFGFIFSLTTIVNTIIAVKMPKQFEDSLSEIDSRIEEVERSAKESTNAAHFIDAVSTQKTTKQKIDAITNVIEKYGDNSGEFYFARGFLYDDIKDYDSARADYTRAKRSGGSEYTFHNSMGVLYSNIMLACTSLKDKTHAFKKSEYHYKKAIKLLEESEEKGDYCHCNLACVYQDYAKTLKSLATLEKIKSREDSATKYAIESSKYTKLALEEFDVAISISDDFLIAYLNRGISYREMDMYECAYEDFQRCHEIDPENEKVLELLASTALSLFQTTNEEEYYKVAKANVKKLRENINKLELLQEKIDAVGPSKASAGKINVNDLLAAIDEKIADLSIEEASEHSDDPIEYGNRMSDALEHYRSSLEMYKKLYADSKDEQYWADILRLQEKISRIESPNT